MIEVKYVRKHYRGGGTVIRDLSLKIEEGQVVGIFGANGAGKSTLLRCMMGLTHYTGEVLIDGQPVRDSYPKIAFISDGGSYFPDLTPQEYGRFLSDFVPAFDIVRYNKLLEFFELFGSHKIKTFSKGQKSKLEVAAGFSRGAKYILMDEPFSGNDLFTRRDFMKLMVSTLGDDETIVITTHLIDEIEQFIDRAIVLRFGDIVADCTQDDLAASGKTLAGLMMEVARLSY